MVAGAGRADSSRCTRPAVTATFLPGVNLGSTTPGPPARRAVDLGRAVPGLVRGDELARHPGGADLHDPPAGVLPASWPRYNQANPDRPLYLMQGVYLPDESYVAKENLFDPARHRRLPGRNCEDAARGGVRQPHPYAVRRAGPSGTWDTDVTPVAGRLDHRRASSTRRGPAASDERNAGAPAGARASTSAARRRPRPTERWLAARMNELADREASSGRSQPIAFVNWPTTDPLRHPDEPLEQEDLLQLDANHVLPTADWPAGTFASYHAYPYYPDFQRHEPGLQSFRVRAAAPTRTRVIWPHLRKHHGTMPTMITEFGVPSSIGSAHNGPLGRDQGDHSEQDAMRIDAGAAAADPGPGAGRRVPVRAGRTSGSSSPGTRSATRTRDRRQLWHDPLTNEQHFGLLAMDAGGPAGRRPGSSCSTPTAPGRPGG